MKTQKSDPTLCHCKKDKHGHQLVPFPLVIEGRLILGCPAIGKRRAARMNAELWLQGDLTEPLREVYKPTPKIPIRYDQNGNQVKVLRAIGLNVIYPPPKWAHHPTRTERK